MDELQGIYKEANHYKTKKFKGLTLNTKTEGCEITTDS